MKFLPQKARKNKTTTTELHSSSDDISDLTHSNYGGSEGTTNNGQQHHKPISSMTSTTDVTAATRSKKSPQSKTNEKSKDTLTKYNNLSSPSKNTNRRSTITEGILSLPTTSTPPPAVQRGIHNFRREPLLSRSITSSQHRSKSSLSSAISLDGQIIAAAAKHKQQQHVPVVNNSPSSKVDTGGKSKEGGGSNENNETNNLTQTKVDEKKNYNNTTRPTIRQHPEWDKCERSTTVTMVPDGSRRGMFLFVCLFAILYVVCVCMMLCV